MLLLVRGGGGVGRAAAAGGRDAPRRLSVLARRPLRRSYATARRCDPQKKEASTTTTKTAAASPLFLFHRHWSPLHPDGWTRQRHRAAFVASALRSWTGHWQQQKNLLTLSGQVAPHFVVHRIGFAVVPYRRSHRRRLLLMWCRTMPLRQCQLVMLTF